MALDFVLAAIGAAIPPAIYLFWFTTSGPDIEARFSSLILFVCPTLIWSMAFDHMAVRDVREMIVLMSLINGASYFVVGVLVFVARETLIKRKAT